MDFRDHRPLRGFGRSARALAQSAQALTRFLPHAQRSLTDATLHLSGRQRATLASILVECAEDLSQDIGLGRSLAHDNRACFGTPLPCGLSPEATRTAAPLNPERLQFFLWTHYAALAPDLILAPTQPDIERLALWRAAFLSARFARLRYDSGVKTFLSTPTTYGWDVNSKLVWLGQHAYLFRLHCEAYVREHGGRADTAMSPPRGSSRAGSPSPAIRPVCALRRGPAACRRPPGRAARGVQADPSTGWARWSVEKAV